MLSNIFIRDNNREIGILAKAAKYLADGSAPIGQDTWTSVYWSAQTALSCADALIKQDADLMIGLTRPAGHHARKDGAGGFVISTMPPSLHSICASILNVLQLSTPTCITDKACRRFSTIEMMCFMYRCMAIPLISTQSWLDLPMNMVLVQAMVTTKISQCHTAVQKPLFDYLDQAVDFVKLYQPDVVVHVMGFDVYVDDPQAKCSVSTEGFQTVAEKIKSIGVPTISLIEGGYCIEKLGENFKSFMRGFGVAEKSDRISTLKMTALEEF